MRQLGTLTAILTVECTKLEIDRGNIRASLSAMFTFRNLPLNTSSASTIFSIFTWLGLGDLATVLKTKENAM